MNKEREKYILESLLKKKRVTVKELANELFASEPSIRRDLQNLEKQNLIKRIHGGAILEEHSSSYTKIPFIIREMEDYDEKIMIAKKAAELVNDGDVIMLDASSSAYAMIPFLAQKANLTVITSGIKTLMQLAEHEINAYSTGGHIISSCFSLVDNDCLATISRYNADIVFFSCRGLAANGDITDFSIEENVVRKKMIEQSEKAILLCASKKFNKTYMHNLCNINDIDQVISEVEFSKEILANY